MEKRIQHWEKLQELRSILEEDFLADAIYEEEYLLDNGKEISRIYVPMNEKVSIHNKNSWQNVMVFFNETMDGFERFFLEYKEVITS